MKEHLTEYIVYIFLLIILTASSLFISFFEGPQIGHYINLFSIIITIWLTVRFVKIYSVKIREIWITNRIKMILGTFGLILQLSIAFTIISIRYGYTNWIYKNPIELVPPNDMAD